MPAAATSRRGAALNWRLAVKGIHHASSAASADVTSDEDIVAPESGGGVWLRARPSYGIAAPNHRDGPSRAERAGVIGVSAAAWESGGAEDGLLQADRWRLAQFELVAIAVGDDANRADAVDAFHRRSDDRDARAVLAAGRNIARRIRCVDHHLAVLGDFTVAGEQRHLCTAFEDHGCAPLPVGF